MINLLPVFPLEHTIQHFTQFVSFSYFVIMCFVCIHTTLHIISYPALLLHCLICFVLLMTKLTVPELKALIFPPMPSSSHSVWKHQHFGQKEKFLKNLLVSHSASACIALGGGGGNLPLPLNSCSGNYGLYSSGFLFWWLYWPPLVLLYHIWVCLSLSRTLLPKSVTLLIV